MIELGIVETAIRIDLRAETLKVPSIVRSHGAAPQLVPAKKRLGLLNDSNVMVRGGMAG